MERENSDHGPCYGWRAVVPATSANLGCAFDCAGLALKLHLNALFIPTATPGLTLEYHGATPERFPFNSTNLVSRALLFAAEQLGAAKPQGHLTIESEIPIGVGLGSSAAAVIAGLLLGVRACGKEVETSQLLGWAREFEGHVDNAAAAYQGGLVFALNVSQGIDDVITAKAPFPESIRIVVVTPSITVPTQSARKVLPESYSRADVVHSLQRTAVLAATCFSERFELLPELFDDKLHQPFRQQLVPGIERCLQLRHRGLLGVAISGSGSSVIAFVTENDAAIAQALQTIFREERVASQALFTFADNAGARVTREPVSLVERVSSVLDKAGRSQ